MNIDVLIERAKAGDKEALGKIIETYKPFVVKTSLGIFITGSDMEDMIQAGCVSIINAVKLYDKSKCPSFTSYVTNAVRNNFFYAIRKASKRNHDCSLEAEISEGTVFAECVSQDLDIEEDYIKKENILRLRAALESLPADELQLLRSFYNAERGTVRREAERLQIKYTAFIKRKDKIIKKLRHQLNIEIPQRKHKKIG